MIRHSHLARWWARTLTVAVATVGALAAVAPAGAAPAEDTTPPTTPGPIEIAEINEFSIRMRWAPSTDDVGVTSYEVSQAFTDIIQLKSTPTNEIFINGLLASRSYSFTVRARDAAGNSSPSVSLHVVMPPGDDSPPTAPGTPTASDVTDTAVTLTWTPSRDNVLLAQYYVVRVTPEGTTVVGQVWLLPPGYPSNSLRLTNLKPETTYTFAVRARDEAGNVSADSPPVTVTTRGTNPGPTSSCAVSYALMSQWDGGFHATVTVRNTGTTAFDNWALRWTFPNGQRVRQSWIGILVVPGPQVEIRGDRWNSQIAPGAALTIGFLGTWQGINGPPTNFSLNEVRCASA